VSESGEKKNMLDLGPLHKKVSTHIQAIINLSIILLFFFVKIPPILQPLLKEMSGNNPLSLDISMNLIFLI